jgi:hypothetical protein
MLGRHEAAGFQHDGAQFLGGKALVARPFRVDPQRPQHGVREQVDEPDEWPRDAHQRRENQARRQRDLFGIRCADDLRRDFREHDDEERDEARRYRQHDVVVAERVQRDRRGEHGNDRVDHVVADQDDAQKLIGFGEQALRRARAQRPLVGEVLQAMAVQRHHRGFGNREEAGEKEKQKNGANLRP